MSVLAWRDFGRALLLMPLAMSLGLTAAAQLTIPQITLPTRPKPVAKPAVPAKPIAAAQPVAGTGRAPLTAASTTANTAANTAVSNTSAASNYTRAPLSSLGGNSAATGNSAVSPSAANSATNGADSRSALNTSNEGLGSFPQGGWNLTAYSCFRANPYVLCDFDLTYQGNYQINANGLYRDFQIVGSSGRPFGRSNAYYVDTDGSQFANSHFTPGVKVRYVMQFEGVPASYSTVTLVTGQTRIANVQITQQEPGTSTTASAAKGSAK